MNFFRSLSIRYKIMSIAIVAIVGFGIYFTMNLSVASNNALRLEQMRDIIFPTLEDSEKNLVRLDQIINLLDQAVATDEEEMVEAAQDTLDAMQTAFIKIRELDSNQVETVKRLQEELTAYFTIAKELTVGMLNDSIKPSEIQSQVQAMQSELNTFREGLTQLRNQSHQAFTQTVATANEAAQSSIVIGAIIGALLVVVLAAAAFLVATGIKRSIVEVSDNLREIANGEGDLTRRLNADSQDEVGQLVGYFNTFMSQLQSLIQELRGYSNHVGKAAEKLATTTQLSRSGMEHQRSDTTQVATASKEMAATVLKVAQSAEQAAEAATLANNAASNGNTVVDDAISIINRMATDIEQGASAVNQLREDTENIGSVLDVIRGIAEQTNLLALNAAIEAARAGEQGRGFAVVADEVRTLARRTQESTQEIQEMIENLQSSAGQAVEIMGRSKATSVEGVTKATGAGQALVSITKAVTLINDMNTQIASATEEQSAVATDMDKNIINISQATDENTKISNQLASAGTSLNDIAIQIQRLVMQFKV
ncbi:MAG: methyl-accepting chemotaxis protein [Candidatus Thiodiazotropha sp. (ex Troendleina suluensis)]|nr:methyl-accepting chemotaxis protein [Candidatus Thiodiazotropha sp. (ex Troendleina suluensis)]